MDCDKFDVSFTVNSYKSKEEVRYYSDFKQGQYSPQEIMAMLRRGHSMSGIFDTKQVFRFYKHFKKKLRFQHTHIVTIDFDETNLTPKQAYESLLPTPSYVYTSYRHKPNIINGNRFHVMYFIGEQVNPSLYQCVYDKVIESVHKVFDGYKVKDNCGRSCYQIINGSNFTLKDFEEFGDGTVYSVCDFLDKEDLLKIALSQSKSPVKTNNNNKKNIISHKRNSETEDTPEEKEKFNNLQFKNDFYSMAPSELIIKYRDTFKYFDRQELNYNNGYALIPDDYKQIYRAYYLDIFNDATGKEHRNSKIKKVRDGQRRRYKLLIGSYIRKLIKPNITFDEMLYNLVCERLYYYDNSDGVLNNMELVRIAWEAAHKDVKDIHLNGQPRRKRRFEIDKAYWSQRGVSNAQARQYIRGILTDEYIGANYDCNKSVKENLDMFKSMGVKISRSRLYEFTRRQGISRTNKRHNADDTTPQFTKENDEPKTSVQETGLSPIDESQDVEESLGCNITVWPWQIDEAVRILDMSLDDNEPENPDNLTQTERYHIYRLFAKRCRRFIHHDFPLEMCQKLFEERFGA